MDELFTCTDDMYCWLYDCVNVSYTVIFLLFVCLWHVPHPIVLWLSRIYGMYICMYVCNWEGSLTTERRRRSQRFVWNQEVLEEAFLVFVFRYHSTNVAYTPQCCCYQKNKRLKPQILKQSNRFSANQEDCKASDFNFTKILQVSTKVYHIQTHYTT